MSTGDLLTVKEFAQAAGVTTQRIYKLMKTTLQPYVANTENGLTKLKSDGLREFGKAPCNDVLQTESCKEQSSSNAENNGDLSPELATQGLQPRVASDKERLIDTQAAEIETIKAELESLHAQIDSLQQQHAHELEDKNTQISFLQAHISEQQQTINDLAAAAAQALNQQQQLNAIIAVIQNKLIDQTEGAGDTPETSRSSETEKEKENAADQTETGNSSTATAAPDQTENKQGFFAKLKAKFSKK